MSLDIVTADQRLADATVKGQVWGPAGVGKTTLLKTLDPATTLCGSVEGGLLSVQRADEFGPRFMGETIEPATWPEIKAITEGFKQRPEALAKYKTVFWDSTSVISHKCLAWCQTQPEAFSEKNGKPEIRGAYGLLAREIVAWAWDWKHMRGVNVWLVGGLEYKENDIGIKEPVPLLAGAKLVAELPYIMDFVLVMDRFKAADGNWYTGLHTDPRGAYRSVPVKTRGGGFEPIEQPHLGKFMAKALGFSPTTAAPPSAIAA